MTFKEKDFVDVEFDMYANSKLVQTTNAKKAKENSIEGNSFGAHRLILGRAMILKALDDEILKGKVGDSNSIELEAKDAFGKRDKSFIKTLQKSVFTQQNMRVVPGVVYDFGGTFGTVKSVVGGRVLVDFNNPLAGKDIKVEYKIVSKVEKIDEKLQFLFKSVLKLPENMFKIEVKGKDVSIKIPEQLLAMKEQLIPALEENLLDFKDYKFSFDKLVESKSSK